MKKDYKNKLTGLEITEEQYMNVDRDLQPDFEYVGAGIPKYGRIETRRVPSTTRFRLEEVSTMASIPPPRNIRDEILQELEGAPTIGLSQLRRIYGNSVMTSEFGRTLLNVLELTNIEIVNDIPTESASTMGQSFTYLTNITNESTTIAGIDPIHNDTDTADRPATRRSTNTERVFR